MKRTLVLAACLAASACGGSQQHQAGVPGVGRQSIHCSVDEACWDVHNNFQPAMWGGWWAR